MSATIGVDFKVHYLQLNETLASQLHSDRMKLSIWDTAGQERFRTLTSSYYRGAQGVILVYDVCNRASFDNLSEIWLPELETYSSSQSGVVKMVVGNKVDKNGRMVSKEEGMRFAQQHGALFLECSAKTKFGVQQAFEELCWKIIETPDLWRKRDEAQQIRLSNGVPEDTSCSC